MKLTSRLFELRRRWSERLHHRWYRLVGPLERRQAIANQQRFCGTYIGVTGSCGKSTTTLLLRTMLGAFGNVHSGTLVNINRSVFRTLRKLRAPADFVVQEISAHSGPGGLAPVTDNLRFDVGIVTAIGKEHRAAYDSIEAIAAEKSRVVAAVHAQGLSVLNADDPLVRGMRSVAGGSVLLYGTAADADVRAENVSALWPSRLGFDLVIGGQRWPVATRFPGTLMLSNILAALATVHGLGHDVAKAIARIADLDPVYEHMSTHAAPDGHTYLLDTTKAPQWSTHLLMQDLRHLRASSTVIVLSQVSDSYGNGATWYRKFLRLASETADVVIAMGQAAERAHRLIESGEATNIRCVDTIAEARAILAALPPSLVIVKSAQISKLSRLYLAALEPITCARTGCHISSSCANCPMLRAA